jgi:hypothetical protein
MIRIVALLLSLGLFVSASVAEELVTLSTLLDEMVRLDRWCRLPSPSYQMVLRSSREPRQMAGQERILLDEAGPGVLTRVVVSRAGRGRLRVYIDDAPEGVIEGTLDQWARGEVSPIERAFLRAEEDRVEWEYPIPFASRCRVTLEGEESTPGGDAVYQVTARLYPPGTMVESFSPLAWERARTMHDRVRGVLSGEASQETSAGWDVRFPLVLSSSRPAAEIQLPKGGGGVIGELHLKPSTNDPALLRECVLAISFDGRTTIRVPIVEFFGSAVGKGSYRSLVSEITTEGEWISRWPMPFLERAEVRIEGPGVPSMLPTARKEKRGPLRRLLRPRESKKSNQGIEPQVAPPEELTVEGYALVGPYRWDDRSMYLHASWRQSEEPLKAGSSNWSGGTLAGRGLWVGSTLVASNPNREWWGTGGESVVVDSNEETSLIGTDASDFFGVTRSAIEPATGGLRGLARVDGPGSMGRSAYFRWRTLDAVPFGSSLRIDWEVGPSGLSLGSVQYWYADAWSATTRGHLKEEEVLLPALPERIVPRIEGAIEGESLVVIHADGDLPTVESRIHQESAGPWSDDHHLVWRGWSPGRELLLSFDAPHQGRYRVVAHFSQSTDYGIHRIAINDQSTGDPIDLFHPEPRRMPAVDLGEFDLRGAGNRLSIRVVSTSKSASPKSCGFGLDALVLTPVATGEISRLSGPSKPSP